MAEQDQKRTMILEAALKRFKRFGLSKTTMEEIARDLEISKGSLYYYFSDKESIYVAVVERMIADCFLDMSAYVETAPSTTAIMNRYLELKEKMLLEYHFLFGVNEWIKDVPSSLMRQTIELLQQVEISFLSATISKGVESGELHEDTDTELTAQLLVNVLFGLWVIWCKWQAAGFDPHDRKALKCFMDREKYVLTIFFNGLRYRPDINQDRQKYVEESRTQE